MPGGVFIGVEKHLIGGVTDATKGLMMSYSAMMLGLAATSATLYIMWRGYWGMGIQQRRSERSEYRLYRKQPSGYGGYGTYHAGKQH